MRVKALKALGCTHVILLQCSCAFNSGILLLLFTMLMLYYKLYVGQITVLTHPNLQCVSVCVCVQAFQKQAETDIRSCCLTEIKQTEEKYTETLESIEKVLSADGPSGKTAEY